jgi:hypothetical protein
MPDDRRLGEPFRLLLRWNEGLVHAHVALDKTRYGQISFFAVLCTGTTEYVEVA